MRYEDVIIIGAGQCGLSMSHALAACGIGHLVLDRGLPGNAWRTARWDSLRLLTPNWANGLPGAPYRGPEPDGYMSVAELAGRMDAYAEVIAAPLQCQTTVRRVHQTDGAYRIETDQGVFASKTVVLATGACARPKIPALADAVPASVFQTTPCAYKRPADLPPGGVLVVGAAASGVQLARELQLSGRPVTLAVGGHVRLPRFYRGLDIERWLDLLGILDEKFDAIEDLERARRVPSPQLIGAADPVDLNALQAIGVEIVGRFSGLRDGRALFSGGLPHLCASADLKMHRLLDEIDAWATARGMDAELPPPDRPEATNVPASPRLDMRLDDGAVGSILWATGYGPDFSWLDLPVFDARGRLRHHGGVVDMPGVYALGLPLLRRRRSHQISGAGEDAQDIAGHVAGHLGARCAA